MRNALGLRREGMTGRTGIEQDIFGKGATASGDLATSLANYLAGRGSLNYKRGLNENQQNSDAWSSLMSNISGIAKYL
jgi:hypothetical protein